MEFWLIQRGKFKTYSNPSEAESLTGRKGLVSLDYMGSSEYEWGAIPNAYRRILAQFDKYKLIQIQKFDSKGNPLWIYVNVDKKDDVIESLTSYINKPYRLKECSGFEDYADYHRKNTDFWWEIENGMDFMFFYGEQDRADTFINTINNAYQNWWLAKPKSEREEEIKKAMSFR